MNHLYKWENIVVGGSLEAILYAFINDYTLIYTKLLPPFEYDFCNVSDDLSFCLLENTETILNGKKTKKHVGLEKKVLFYRLLFFLSLTGKVPCAQMVHSISSLPNNILKIVLERSRIIKVVYDKLHVFKPQMIKNLTLEVLEKNLSENIVYDYLEIVDGCKYEYLYHGDGFPNEVYINDKQVISLSSLSYKELREFDFSEFMIKNTLNKILRKKGKIEHIKRVVKEQDFLYKDYDDIMFKNYGYKEILSMKRKINNNFCKIEKAYRDGK